MKILLLGGTGAIGRDLSLALSRENVKIFITSRSKHTSVNSVHYIQGNAKDKAFLSTILVEKFDAIVDFMNYTEQEFRDSISILLRSTSCYYFLSSSRVYANSIEPITEASSTLLETATDSEYKASNEYGLTKAKEENILRNSNYKNWVILRPYIIYSDSRFQLGALEKEDWLFRVLEGKSIVMQKSLLQKTTTLTYSSDAAEVISSIILTNKSRQHIFNIVGSYKCQATWGEVLQIYKEILEEKLNRKIRVFLLSDTQSKQLRKGKAYFQTSFDRMYNRIFDNSSITAFKCSESYIPIREGLNKSLDNFLENPRFQFVNYAQEALIDRFTGEWSNIFKISGFKHKIMYLFYRLIKKY